MDSTEISALLILIILFLGVFLFWLWNINKKRKIEKEIPSEIIEQFNEAERRYTENGGEDPYRIIKELGRDYSEIKKRESATTRGDKQITTTGIFQESGEQCELQNNSNPTLAVPKPTDSRDSSNIKRINA